ncbi:helix-turn-helix transcriptional regulator [Fulvimarina sp. MAC8]|uniref:helix-turn-helix transcriptional regulator n=1 Tax=Fulvimarina sp. MAC8 TaxID=3162874 RepID=UPI0032F02ADE
MDDFEIIDRIYEAGLRPELWLDLLDDLSEVADGAGAALFSIKRGSVNYIATDRVAQLFEDFIALGQPQLNVRLKVSQELDHPGFVREQEFLPGVDLAELPFYSDFLWPRGFGWCMATPVKAPTQRALVYTIEGKLDAGPFPDETRSRFDRLRPHLCRAAILSGRLALERAQAAADALSLVGMPAAVIGANDKIMTVNTLFEPLMPTVIQDRSGRVRFAEKGADQLLADALEAGADSGACSIPLRPSGELPPMVAHLIPVKRTARDVFSAASWILTTTAAASSDVPSAEIIRCLFDLTPAEARVARGIASGHSPNELAIDAGLSPATVRTQLKAVYAKTGANRQAELVRLLSGFSLANGSTVPAIAAQ